MEPTQTLRQQLCEPGFIAAAVTVVAVAAMTWYEPGRTAAGLTGAETRWVALCAIAVFMALLVWLTLVREGIPSRTQIAIALLQAGIALLVAASSRSGSGPILLVIVMAELASRLSSRQTWWCFGVINVLLFLVHWQYWGIKGALIGGLSYGGFQLFAMIIIQYAVRSENNSLALREVNAHLLATRSLLAESARDQERLRIARELHDVAGHKLTALKLQLRHLERRSELADNDAVRVSAQLADELLADMRAVVQQMREHDGMNLRAAIEQLIAPFPKPKVIIDIAEDARVDSVAKADAIVRAVQEALTNAARHGDAQHLWINLRREGDRVEITIRDDGTGARGNKLGNGLIGMCERFRDVGGEVALDTDRARGYSIHAWVPVA